MRVTPEEVARWREASQDARADLVIENIIPTAHEEAFLQLMLEEAVPPPLATQIGLKLMDDDLTAKRQAAEGACT